MTDRCLSPVSIRQTIPKSYRTTGFIPVPSRVPDKSHGLNWAIILYRVIELLQFVVNNLFLVPQKQLVAHQRWNRPRFGGIKHLFFLNHIE